MDDNEEVEIIDANGTTVKTTLSKAYPKVDKICDAKFITKCTGMTKKATTAMILGYDDCRRFFQNTEDSLSTINLGIRDKIEKYFSTIPEILKSAQMAVKEEKALKLRQNKEKQVLQNDVLKAQVRAELKAEMAEEARIAAIRSELSLPPTPPVAAPVATPVAISPAPRPTVSPPAPATAPLALAPVPVLTPLTNANPNNALVPITTPSNGAVNNGAITEIPAELGLEDIYTILLTAQQERLLRVMSSGGQELTFKSLELKDTHINLVIELPVPPTTPVATPSPGIVIRPAIRIIRGS